MSFGICELSEDFRDQYKTLSFGKQEINTALILKIDMKTKEVIVDKKLSETTIEEIAEELPSAAPRYIVYSYKHVHDVSDAYSRFSIPIIFIFYCPPGLNTYTNMIYTSTKITIMDEIKSVHVYDVQETSVLTSDWLKEKLKGYR
ncbi:hypothetical protein M0811_09340 [Anaeramoeba ignava]|uniref:ADF-H domain-containing protein n=1 Tax=Anaeramoeba ignava TaxID=1746090 RepID=A0A9Q0RAB0_ANAIG|nr:hypothetical protein M0811_12778 [Anaeramoeba ignava]KAJ5072894.1 hypothetical protein M0811_09340 [Anaeramoeba ignava]|eukprot:Anaeramoba_ignava/a610556_78.p1 GENE.a610556_78~~a610556_78.p1  ORF type:complete len:145 (-),score=25.86 a610556_78:84-518(-)